MADTILYLQSMGMNDNALADIKNHRVRVINNIDINYKGELYNMFFEFRQWNRYHYRTTNKRTGAPLKHSIKELINPNALCVDTEFEKPETLSDGRIWLSSWRHSALEKEIHDNNPNFTKADILKVVNTYAVNKFSGVVIVEQEARQIINRLGGYREKSILANDPVFRIGETWNDDHKIIKVTERNKHELGNSCEVDIATGKITN